MTSSVQVNSAFEDTLEVDGSSSVESNPENMKNLQLCKSKEGAVNHGYGSSVTLPMTDQHASVRDSYASKESTFSSVFYRAKEKTRKSCTIDLLKHRLPFLLWLPNYAFGFLFYDFLAGFTAALTGIPQGIAYGAVAGVPVEYGLYTAFAAPMVYAFLGSVSQVTVGPTAVMALMASEYVQKGGIEYAIVLSFLAGCFELISGALNLGFLVDFISGPVISGFCSAAATTVIFSQIKTILGLQFRGSSFTKVIPGIFTNLSSISLWDTLLGCLCMIFILSLKNLPLLKNLFKTSSCLKDKYVDKALWYIATCRNAFALLIGCIIAYVLNVYSYHPFSLTGDIKSGIPSFQVPPFTFEKNGISLSNRSDSMETAEGTETVAFLTIVKDIGTGLVLVPVIAILEQVAIAKAFCKHKKLDSTQEMIALGTGSVVCSFLGCFPPTASFARSSVLAVSGGKTQLASFFNGCVVLVALAFLMPAFYYIPKAVLGAVIVTAVYPMVEYHELLSLWRSRRTELLPFLTTYLCCLLISLEYGILIGIEVHLLLIVYEATRTKVALLQVDKDGENEKVVLAADRSLYFPSVERVRDALNKLAEICTSNKTLVVIDMAKVADVDHTNLKVLKAQFDSFQKAGFEYQVINVNKEVWKVLASVFDESFLHATQSIPVSPTNVTHSNEKTDESLNQL